MTKDDCIFCKLANGVFPTHTLYEDQDFRVFLDASPAAAGHALVVPKNHFANLMEADEDTLSKALIVAQKVAKAQMQHFNCDGVNIIQNNGEAAGQTVFHLHIHVIPRYNNDTVRISYVHGEPEEEQQKALAKALSEQIQA